MTIMEQIEYNHENNILYIKIDAENRVSHTSEMDRDIKTTDWIKVYYDYVKTLCTVGDKQWLYDAATNTISEKDCTFFNSVVAEKAKDAKIYLVSKLQVTTLSGKVFDGDEKSQDRMLRAINIAAITGSTKIRWKLANNDIIEITLDELKEALTLASKAMSDIWL